MTDNIVSRLANQAYSNLLSKRHPNCGLLGGDFGENMLLFMTGKDTNAEECLKHILNSIQSRSQVPTYCNGLAGLGVGLLWLEQEKIIDGVSDNLNDFDIVLLNSMRHMVVEDNFDFLHGAVGIGLYFVDRFKTQPEISTLAIRELVDAINRKSIRNSDGAVRLVYDHKDPVKRFNMSLSHGLSGTMLFLCRVAQSAVTIHKQRMKIYSCISDNLRPGAVTVLPSLIHMHFNRLFTTSQRLAECICYVLLERAVKSHIARVKCLTGTHS